jgi:hypothetical protein
MKNKTMIIILSSMNDMHMRSRLYESIHISPDKRNG